jgi:hypothetical protein
MAHDSRRALRRLVVKTNKFEMVVYFCKMNKKYINKKNLLQRQRWAPSRPTNNKQWTRFSQRPAKRRLPMEVSTSRFQVRRRVINIE